MNEPRKVPPDNLQTLQYPLIDREEESLELTELYDGTYTAQSNYPDEKDADVNLDNPLSKIATVELPTRSRVWFTETAKPRIVSPLIIKPTHTVDEYADTFHPSLQRALGEIEAYSNIINHQSLTAQELPRPSVEVLDIDNYRTHYAARKNQSLSLIEQVVDLRKKIRQAQGMIDSLPHLFANVSTEHNLGRSNINMDHATPMFDQLLAASKPPLYEQNCKIVWSSRNMFALLAHIKHSTNSGTDIFIATIDAELTRFRRAQEQEQEECNGSHDKPPPLICNLDFYFKKRGNQLFLQLLYMSILSNYHPVLYNYEKCPFSEPKLLHAEDSLDILDAVLDTKKSLPSEITKLTIVNISAKNARNAITQVLDAFQRLFAQFRVWGVLGTQQTVFVTYTQSCPHFFESRSDRFLKFMASQSSLEPGLKLLAAKSTTIQTFSKNCIYCKLYTACSLESVIVRLNFQSDPDGDPILHFTPFRFSSGDLISDADVRSILSIH